MQNLRPKTKICAIFEISMSARLSTVFGTSCSSLDLEFLRTHKLSTVKYEESKVIQTDSAFLAKLWRFPTEYCLCKVCLVQFLFIRQFWAQKIQNVRKSTCTTVLLSFVVKFPWVFWGLSFVENKASLKNKPDRLWPSQRPLRLLGQLCPSNLEMLTTKEVRFSKWNISKSVSALARLLLLY